MSESTCHEISHTVDLSDTELESLRLAATLIVVHLNGIKEELPSSLEEDEEEVGRIRRCRAYASKHRDVRKAGLGCPVDSLEWGHAIEMAAVFRAERKKVIRNVVERLVTGCIHDEGGEELGASRDPNFATGHFGGLRDEL